MPENNEPTVGVEKNLFSQKIFPRNLTARAGQTVTGNPVTTRLESGVGNCYPGLEYDHRNLDRRFFPGLIFEFVSQDDADAPNLMLRGLRLMSIDLTDSELRTPRAQQLASMLSGNEGTAISSGRWFVDEIEQGGVTLRTYATDATGARTPLDGMVVYHFVRGLEADGDVRITLARRQVEAAGGGAAEPPSPAVVLNGWRRRYVNEEGVISEVYDVGELTQSLCSPWMHDFRDCGCNYWASNHPDIVLAEDYPGEPLLPTGGSANTFRDRNPIDWLRADRNRDAAAEAFPTRGDNRPYQMDHYEINRRWEQLDIVLGGKEVSQLYRLGEAKNANPLATPEEVGQRLVYLATLEHVLILEYLYAYFSIAPESRVNPQRWPEIDKAVIFARHELLMIAISEMRHLRWANQLLWELGHAGLISPDTGPSLGVAKFVPVSHGKTRERALRVLSMPTLDDFIAVEAPSGTLDGQYAEVAATLRLPAYPQTASQLAERIIADGVAHFSRFREVKLVLKDYTDPNTDPEAQPYLLNLRPAPPDHALAREALDAYRQIIGSLSTAYGRGDMEDANDIIIARTQMVTLQTLADRLLTEGLGVPFFAGLPDEVA